MRKYVISHWRGEHHITWLVLVNGTMVYLVLLAVFAALIGPYAWRSATKGPVTPYWLIPVVAVMVWSGVGIVRGRCARLQIDTSGEFRGRLPSLVCCWWAWRLSPWPMTFVTS
jgi:hypothetical protein